MSKRTEVICDRCGREITDYDIKMSSARIDFWGVGVLRGCGGQRIDLYLECHEKFLTFLEGSHNDEQRD